MVSFMGHDCVYIARKAEFDDGEPRDMEYHTLFILPIGIK
jgi:hypothetical protein